MPTESMSSRDVGAAKICIDGIRLIMTPWENTGTEAETVSALLNREIHNRIMQDFAAYDLRFVSKSIAHDKPLCFVLEPPPGEGYAQFERSTAIAYDWMEKVKREVLQDHLAGSCVSAEYLSEAVVYAAKQRLWEPKDPAGSLFKSIPYMEADRVRREVEQIFYSKPDAYTVLPKNIKNWNPNVRWFHLGRFAERLSLPEYIGLSQDGEIHLHDGSIYVLCDSGGSHVCTFDTVVATIRHYIIHRAPGDPPTFPPLKKLRREGWLARRRRAKLEKKERIYEGEFQ